MPMHGKNTVIKTGNYASTLTDISAYTDAEDLSRQADSVEDTTFGADGQPAKGYIAGLKDGTFTASGPWDPAIDRHMDGIVGRERAFELGPEGPATGKVKYSGNAICTGYSGSSAVGDKITWSADFQITGDVTRGTW